VPCGGFDLIPVVIQVDHLDTVIGADYFILPWQIHNGPNPYGKADTQIVKIIILWYHFKTPFCFCLHFNKLNDKVLSFVKRSFSAVRENFADGDRCQAQHSKDHRTMKWIVIMIVNDLHILKPFHHMRQNLKTQVNQNNQEHQAEDVSPINPHHEISSEYLIN
jgi:hypothetical protein